MKLDVELPPERLSRAVDQAVQRLARRTRVPGFRPGKAPRAMLERVLGQGAVLDEAVEHLVEDAYRDALVEKLILPLNQAKIDVQQAEEGKALVFSATVAVRPDVKLGDYRDFNFKPEIEQITDVTVDKVIAACKKHGKWPGMGGAYSEELLQLYIGKGMKLLLAGNDLPMLTNAARTHQAKVRAFQKTKAKK